MAFSNVAGRAGFIIELDKSQLDKGLPEAERQFNRATANMAASASRSGVTVSRQFDSLLGSVRGMRQSAEDLEGQLGKVTTAADTAGAAGAGLAGRLGLITTAGYALYQGTQQLSRSLKTTGEEAYTTTGRLKNLGSALLSGDIIGGIKALSDGPKTLDEWGVSLQEVEENYKAFKALAESGGPFSDLAKQAIQLADATRVAIAAQDALNFSLRTTNTLASGGVIPVGTRPDEGAASPGAIAAAQAAVAATGGTGAQGRPAPKPIGPTSRRQAAIVIAQANGDLETVLRLQIEERDRLQKAYTNSTGNVKQRQALNAQLATATAAVIGTRKAIDSQNQARKQAADAAAKAAKDEADRQYRAGLAAREQQLRNQYARAQATPGRGDDLSSASILSAFLGRESRDARLTAGERADFRSRQIAFIKQRTSDAKAIADAAVQATRDQLKLQEQVLRNNVAAAALSEKNKKDDLRALRKLRDFYKREQNDSDLTAAERQDARGNRIATQKQINDLLKGKTTKSDAPTFAEVGDVIREAFRGLVEIQNRFNANFSGGTGLNTYVLEQINRAQVGHLADIARNTSRGGRAYDDSVMS